MTHRIHNFNAGPATLPLSVLEEVQAELLDFKGCGMSIMEMSHRSPEYMEVHTEVQTLTSELLGLGDDYKVLFLGGGASTQFYMIPQNLLSGGRKGDYIVTGTWAKKAAKEAKLFGEVHIAHDAANADGKFTYIPTQDQLHLSPDAAYLHYTTNNTIAGTQFHYYPKAPAGVPVICDMSSDIFWKKFDPRPFGLIYAGAQKNLGPAGVTMVIIRKDMLDRCADGIPTMISYKTHADNDSLFNTAPVFPIYVVGKVLKWIKALGGLGAIEKRNREKAGLIYGAIDANPDFFRSPIQRESRSVMNIVWRLPSEDLEKTFIAEAKKSGLGGLKGHRSVGGCRASTYNAMPIEGVKALVGFMEAFAKKNG
ncbi:MAG: 3-phosphoserine/phosphohydroxythreonine transaminase [Candidatus Eisenbacteria bacterium]|uniref:Phosphoserine aminotransferase n=1 Tax=Eiseniibacteriota bacterium TaxID=2212470 RepID=A0A948RSZ2_UNCEI|nr:3-phosphoserine/phosphohydroxythreonine transaminase [Candidatus Eisenbacteria bacterium]MBU1949367.1 3-phosphoserine/phosphohydroxythreonine transaminase [Candidatus Eisenbacteria bacterium]MBU2690440.1 3-phosphoserine/phosphohydroxythreonine transaminase [Candidatus Eisenbacteria bacterium]